MGLALALTVSVGVAAVLAWGAWATARERPTALRVVASSLLAFPMAWLGVLVVAQRAADAVSGTPAVHLAFAAGAIVALAVAQGVALRLRPELLYASAAALPIAAIAVGSVKPPTTTGGALAALVSLALMAAAVVMPRALALAWDDPERRFVAIVIGVCLLIAGILGAILSWGALAEGALGLG